MPSPSGTLALAVERRNTLHFNPAHVPRLDPGETFLAEKNAAPGAGAGAGPGPGRGRGLRGIPSTRTRRNPGPGLGPDSSRRGARTSRTRGTRRRTRLRGARDSSIRTRRRRRARRLRRGAIATRTRHRVRSRTRTGSTPRFDIPAIEDGFDRAWLPGSSKTKTTARVRRRGRASGAARGGGAGSCERGNARDEIERRRGVVARVLGRSRRRARRRCDALFSSRAGVLRIHRSRGVYVVEFAVFQRRVDVHPSRGFHRNHITTSPRASHASSTLKVRYRLRKSQTRTRRRG